MFRTPDPQQDRFCSKSVRMELSMSHLIVKRVLATSFQNMGHALRINVFDGV